MIGLDAGETIQKAFVSPHGKRRKCPRCGGSMSLEFDKKSGFSRECLDCGRVEYIDQRPYPGNLRNKREQSNRWDIAGPEYAGKY